MNTFLNRNFHLRIGGVIFFLFILMTDFAQNPATLTGIVTNCLTGTPVIGAKITVGTLSTWSVSGGNYTLSQIPPGSHAVTCSKTGFEQYGSSPLGFYSGSSQNFPICLNESANPPYLAEAALDTTTTPHKVGISWQLPRGDYELLYDDGIQDDFTVWSVQGNLNAVRFTPLMYPATVTGGKVNIGTAANYQSGSSPFVPFQIDVYDASGPGGMPGVKIAGPIDVLPTNFGWVEFSIYSPPVINSGNFYLVMVQGGNAPNAAGLAIDNTNPLFRSFSRFVTNGTSPWVPGSGNFMMRAIVNGPGGPGLLNDSPAGVTGYTVSRLWQGEEQNPTIWTLIGATGGMQINDNSWSSLPCGPYRWAVGATYPGNRVSQYTFSNVIGKCWTVRTSVKVTLSCDSTTMRGVTVTLKNLVYPDTSYTHLTDTSGLVSFSKFWKGVYELKVTRFGYQDFVQNVSINKDSTFHVFLLQSRTAPTGLKVNDSSLWAQWNKPVGSVNVFNESWQSGSFITNNWTVQGNNWIISTAIGNQNPSVMFNWVPAARDYSESLTSKPITGENSPVLRLKYDIYLDNFGTTSLNEMATEIWDGTTWHVLKSYSNSHGDIPWTTEDLDISAYTGLTFKIKFLATGTDSYDINNWNIDNIKVEAREPAAVAGECVLGYNVYLNNILSGFTHDTTFQIQPSLVTYGVSYTACVDAIYGSGPSALNCYSFVSSYLPPPSNLRGTNINDAASLNWDKPQSKMKEDFSPVNAPPGLKGYIVYRDGVFIDSIKNSDTLRYLDQGLFPDSYYYKVSSWYDLSSYGNPGHFAQSYPAGPVVVDISYGLHLPFSESWDHGNFNYNQWNFEQDAGNWTVTSTLGNPAPSAQFSCSPHITNYSDAMVSPILNASTLGCSNVYLNYDYRLLDNLGNGNEKMNVEVYYNSIWHPLETYSNTGTTTWISRHLDITPVKGKAFQIRFRASGINSANIINWNIDNISVYGVCKPPEQLIADTSGNTIRLTWSSPVCDEGFPMNEGFEESVFPPVNWSQIITNINDITWKQTSESSPAGVHSGQHAAGVISDYVHQDEWLIAHNVDITGDLQFWSYAFQGSTHHDHYYVKISQDHGANWETLLDMSALPLYPSGSGYNAWISPYNVSLSSHLGQVMDIAWQAVDGDGQGLWKDWLIDDCSVGSKMLFSPEHNPYNGAYSVYRQNGGTGNYQQINSSPVYDTTFIDANPVSAVNRYYITVFNPDCSFATSSDTVLVTIITGISSHTSQFLNVYPNPANNIVTVKSSGEINALDVFNYLGQTVYKNENFSGTEVKVNVSEFQQGVYFFRIKSEKVIRTFKVSVVR
jgi:hypothetical protein